MVPFATPKSLASSPTDLSGLKSHREERLKQRHAGDNLRAFNRILKWSQRCGIDRN